MSSTRPVIFILGSGSNVGTGVAQAFAANGYQVARAARRLEDGRAPDGSLNVKVDLRSPQSVSAAFERVTSALGPPSVVVYNAASCAIVPARSPLDLSLVDYHNDLAVNTTSVLMAAKEAVLSFEKLPLHVLKTFIYTGNVLNTEPVLPLVSLGIGKSATAHLISGAALAYKERGFRFYYADERKGDGSTAGGAIDGAAHGEFYYELATRTDQGVWLATFVKGHGYVEFPGVGYVKAPLAA